MTTAKITGPALLRAIADRIDERPDQYGQGDWFWDEAWGYPPERYAITTVPRLIEGECGTRACIAGWACALNWDVDMQRRYLHVIDWEAEAAALLELPLDEAAYLFSSGWEPAGSLSVPDALRAIADGESVWAIETAGY